MTDNQKTTEKKEVAQENKQPAGKVESPRVEDVRANKPLTTPPSVNVVNPVANADSIDPATGYDPDLVPAGGLGPSASPTGALPESEDDEGVVSIKGKDKAQILMNLYNAAAPRGLGQLQATHDWTIEDAQLYMERAQAGVGKGGFGMGRLIFGDIFGRRIDVDLSGDTLDLRRYRRANGNKAADSAV